MHGASRFVLAHPTFRRLALLAWAREELVELEIALVAAGGPDNRDADDAVFDLFGVVCALLAEIAPRDRAAAERAFMAAQNRRGRRPAGPDDVDRVRRYASDHVPRVGMFPTSYLAARLRKAGATITPSFEQEMIMLTDPVAATLGAPAERELYYSLVRIGVPSEVARESVQRWGERALATGTPMNTMLALANLTQYSEPDAV